MLLIILTPGFIFFLVLIIFFFRHWFSTNVARFLEPIAVKKASLITGVAESYYKGVMERNPLLLHQAVVGAMPYGGEKTDHEKLSGLNIQPWLFKLTILPLKIAVQRF